VAPHDDSSELFRVSLARTQERRQPSRRTPRNRRVSYRIVGRKPLVLDRFGRNSLALRTPARCPVL
jgi:hypothetical protein